MTITKRMYGSKAVASHCGVPSSVIANGLYRGWFPGGDAECPLVAGRRLIPEDFIPVIEATLRRRGILGAAARPGR